MNGRQTTQQPPHTQLASILPACSIRATPAHIAATENEISPAAWPLIHLAAACSDKAYNGVTVSLATPSAALERIKIGQHRTSSQSRVTVVAVAGTRGLKDLLVNLKNSASEPVGVLGGQRNLCHTGFLEAVKILISPLALSLSAVERGSTLLFTGHSAGAAIASLLFAHLKSTKTSPLAETAAGFDAIHCIVFGAPPISTTPLPVHGDERSNHQGSLFLSLINDSCLQICLLS
ncbi:lipase class 3 [Paraphaeosphaeria minitans]|uniref:sn-1-specific diacylglycerol lipase n=1 Tax=Paraphaeosphaeria minitans TaxID=565426 RepID=A0A9P6KJG2_9PLEO|nr:lipase class 3 [Paraphaeosphaeria minitans]